MTEHTQSDSSAPGNMDLQGLGTTVERVQLNLILIPRTVPATIHNPRDHEDVLTLESSHGEDTALFTMCEGLDGGLVNLPWDRCVTNIPEDYFGTR
jgi:hypothetical protein